MDSGQKFQRSRKNQTMSQNFWTEWTAGRNFKGLEKIKSCLKIFGQNGQRHEVSKILKISSHILKCLDRMDSSQKFQRSWKKSNHVSNCVDRMDSCQQFQRSSCLKRFIMAFTVLHRREILQRLALLLYFALLQYQSWKVMQSCRVCSQAVFASCYLNSYWYFANFCSLTKSYSLVKFVHS